jgi:hypothetical protein
MVAKSVNSSGHPYIPSRWRGGVKISIVTSVSGRLFSATRFFTIARFEAFGRRHISAISALAASAVARACDQRWRQDDPAPMVAKRLVVWKPEEARRGGSTWGKFLVDACAAR